MPWWRRQRWSERSRLQRALIVAGGACAWFGLVIAYGLVQREGAGGDDPVPARSLPPLAVAAAAGTTTTSTPPTTLVAAQSEDRTPAPPSSPPAETPPPVAAPAPTPAPAPARPAGCDAVADDLGTVEPGGRVAFRLDPNCPYRPGSVTIAVNGGPARAAEVDENGVVWVEVGR